MSQRSTGKYRFTLQVILSLCVFGLVACASQIPKHQGPVHPSSGDNAKTLKYQATIDVVGLGFGDSFKRFFVGDDFHDLKRPIAIGLRDEIMYIADADACIIFRYGLDTGRMDPMWGAGEFITDEATDIYVAKDHSFYVADIDGRRVLHFSNDGRLIQEYFDGPNISRPLAITVNEENGDLLVADEVYSHVVTFNKEGEPLRGYGGRGEGPGKFRIITDMYKTEDAFYISDRVELSVQVLDLKGRYLTHFGEGQLVFPSALAVDSFGRVYVAEKNESRIKVFKQGELIDELGKNGYGKGEFRYISDMKIHNNYLYVVDSLNGRIQVFEILPEGENKTAALQ